MRERARWGVPCPPQPHTGTPRKSLRYEAAPVADGPLPDEMVYRLRSHQFPVERGEGDSTQCDSTQCDWNAYRRLP